MYAEEAENRHTMKFLTYDEYQSEEVKTNSRRRGRVGHRGRGAASLRSEDLSDSFSDGSAEAARRTVIHIAYYLTPLQLSTVTYRNPNYAKHLTQTASSAGRHGSQRARGSPSEMLPWILDATGPPTLSLILSSLPLKLTFFSTCVVSMSVLDSSVRRVSINDYQRFFLAHVLTHRGSETPCPSWTLQEVHSSTGPLNDH